MRIITKKEFELYKKECEKWLEVFGLQSWNVSIIQKEIDPEEAFGACEWEYENRCASLVLNTKCYLPNLDIKETALHECLELLLCPLQDLAQCRNWDHSEWTKERHSVINTVARILQYKT